MSLTPDQLASIFPNPLLNATGVAGMSFPNYDDYGEEDDYPVRRTDFEGNVISVRPKGDAISRRIFTMSWKKLKTADLTVLRTHYRVYHGKRFVFYPPPILLASNPTQWTDAQKESNAVFCVYGIDRLVAKLVGVDRWRVDVSLYEAISNVILEGV